MTALTIGLDTRRLADSGIGTYTRFLIDAILAVKKPEIKLVLMTDPKHANEWTHPDTTCVPCPYRPYDPREQGFVKALVRSHNITVFHATYPWRPIGPLPCRWVCTLHDLIPFQIRGAISNPVLRSYFRLMTRFAVMHSTEVIAVSEWTRQQAIERWPSLASSIRTVHNGVDHITTPDESTYIDSGNVPYLLYVGQWKEYKGLPLLISAFEKLKQLPQFHPFHLKITGRPSEPILDQINDSSATACIEMLGYVSLDEIQNLYQNCGCTILPSRLEGFGFPYIEALLSRSKLMAYHTPITDELKLPKSYLFDEFTDTALCDAIQRVLQSPLETIPNFSNLSWKNCATLTLEALEQI